MQLFISQRDLNCKDYVASNCGADAKDELQRIWKSNTASRKSQVATLGLYYGISNGVLNY
jgi:hypothetical protein